MLPTTFPRRFRMSLVAVWLVVGFSAACAPALGQDSERLLDREPFDRIVLNELDKENVNKTLEVLPLDVSGRAEDGDLPETGQLEFRLVDSPTRQYAVLWGKIAAIRSFQEVLLEEGQKLSAAGQFDDAYDYLAFLKKHHPDLPGLASVMDEYLYRHAFAAFEAKQYDDALSIILALYDSNPKRPGLDRAVGQIAERLIDQRFQKNDFAAAWHFVSIVPRRFPSLKVSSVQRWKKRLQKLADQRLEEATRHFEAKEYDKARASVRAAVAIRPSWEKAISLAAQVQQAWPQMVVAVENAFHGKLTNRLDDWTSRRVRRLTRQRLMELRGYGAEGGIYASPLGEVVPDVAGDRLTILLNRSHAVVGADWNAFALSRRLLATAREEDSAARELAMLLKTIEVEDGRTLHIDWTRPHVRPEALLQIELAGALSRERGDASQTIAAGRFRLTRTNELETRFERRSQVLPHRGESPIEIVERQFENEAKAIEALEKGQIDIVERVSPWNRKRLARTPHIVVASYALPTVHALVLNPVQPLLERSEMRRAIAYGIDRPSILSRVVLAGERISGYSLLSGPFPIGRELNAPIAYAYDRQVVQRGYSPRLSATLATVARQSLTGEPENDDSSKSPAPLILAHSPGDFTHAVCQVIARQLGISGIPIELIVAEPMELAEQSVAWDLRYAELAMWEPVVDAVTLLGPNGEAGVRNTYLALSLRRLEKAQNWPQVREHLHTVHRVVHNELAIIPLWQTVNAFAYRDNVAGIGEEPVTLYDNVSNWRKTPTETKR